MPTCVLDHDSGGGIDPIEVGPFFPATYKAATRTSPWDTVGAVAHPARLDGALGSILHFEVTVTARGHDVSLAACPDFQVGFDTRGTSRRVTFSSVTHQLNCAAVPSHDADGTPYRPRDTPVTFAIEVTAPPATTIKGGWQLTGAPSAFAPLAFTPDAS